MGDRSFGDIMSLLSEYEQLGDLHATVIDDGYVALICKRLDEMPIPPVSPDEVRCAWALPRDELPGPPPGFFDREGGA